MSSLWDFYSHTLTSLKQLPQHALVAIPNDPSNEGRALTLLAHEGLIRLRSGSGLLATPRDIVNNPKQLRFKAIDAAQIPRVLGSVAMGGRYQRLFGRLWDSSSKKPLFHEGANVPLCQRAGGAA